MSDPFTLSVVGTAVLTEGVKFLYNQAAEVLKLWMKRREAKAAQMPAEETEEVQVRLPDAFEGELMHPKVHFDAVAELEEQVLELRRDVGDLVEGLATLEGHRDKYEQRIDALRQCMEAVYQQRFTFKGEERPSSGPMVKGKINVKEVAGYVAAVRAKSIQEGDIGVDVTVESVGKGAEVVGVDADTIGRRRP
jgi:hypothetical protein